MTTQATTSTEQQVLAVLADQAAAITAGDARRALGHLGPGFVGFDLAPPLELSGPQVYDPAGLASWFESWDGPVGLDIGEPSVLAGGDVAFTYGLSPMHGVKADGQPVDLWYRTTVGLRRIDGDWKIVHEHKSTPFLMDGSDKAALDLKPERPAG